MSRKLLGEGVGRSGKDLTDLMKQRGLSVAF